MKTLLGLLAFSLLSASSLADEATSGTLYRNGGHYGTANSDIQLEAPASEAAPQAAPQTETIQTVQTQTWHGTLYRNGGHYGIENSDEKIRAGRQ